MKIIDNRKDFYDFMCGMYDTDDSIVYVRKTQTYRKSITDDKSIIELVKKHLGNRIPEFMYKHIVKWEPNQIFFEHLVIGIYPYVYIVPFIVATEYNESKYSKYSVRHICPIPLDIYTDENKILDYYLSKYPEDKSIKFRMNTINSRNGIYWTHKGNKFVSDNIIKNDFRFEDKDLFEKVIAAPTFIYIPDDVNQLYGTGDSSIRNLIVNDYSHILTKSRHDYDTILIVNPVFNNYPSKILNPIRDLLFSTPIYNDIENFLWAIKQEPESIPDNNTKILSHGFDLKTSFRKM